MMEVIHVTAGRKFKIERFEVPRNDQTVQVQKPLPVGLHLTKNVLHEEVDASPTLFPSRKRVWTLLADRPGEYEIAIVTHFGRKDAPDWHEYWTHYRICAQ